MNANFSLIDMTVLFLIMFMVVGARFSGWPRGRGPF
jgi:hypothetical protein